MPVILSIETATPVCSVAVHSGAEVMAHSHLFRSQSASSRLALMIEEILKHCDIKPNDLDAIAVSEGPGSYTGLRIGVATAKGFCFALSKPLIAVNTLASMIRQVQSQGFEYDFLCPMLDARRMEVYCMLSDRKGIIEDTQAMVIDEGSFRHYLDKGRILFFGNGSDKCRELIKNENAVFVSGLSPSAVQIGQVALEKYDAKDFEDVAEFEPFYLKDFLVKKPKAAF